MIFGIYGIEGLLLFMAGIEDIRKKEIPFFYIILMGIVALGGSLLRENHSWYGSLGGFLIGVCMIGIAYASAEHIGRGDGMVIAALGILCGVRNTLGIVCFASLFMLVLAFGLIITKKAGKKTRLPFLPSLFLGYVMNFLLGGGI